MSSRFQEDLFITGSKPRVWEKPFYTSYSHTHNDSDHYAADKVVPSEPHHSHHHPEDPAEYMLRVRDYHNPSELTMDNHTAMRKSVTFNKHSNTPSGSSRHYKSRNSRMAAALNGVLINSDSGSGGGYPSGGRDSVGGHPRPRRLEETEWYTRPLHKDYGRGAASPADGALGVALAVRGKLDKMAAGTSHSHNSTSDNIINTHTADLATDTLTSHNPDHIDIALAKKFFPVTLGPGKEVGGKPFSPDSGNESLASGSFSPPSGLIGPDAQPWKAAAGHNKSSSQPAPRSKRPSSGHSSSSSRRRSRPSSAQSSSSSASRSSLDRMYLMGMEAPHIASPTLLLSSPYQCELARLRMDRLRIEEEHLLEVKRQDELERIRGPQPKWYELKGPQFHYEAHKNNELIASRDSWQTLLDYRGQLEAASNHFHHTYSNHPAAATAAADT